MRGLYLSHSPQAEEVPVEEDDPGAYVEDEEAPGRLPFRVGDPSGDNWVQLVTGEF